MNEQLVLHENASDYTPAERMLLEQAADSLIVRAQGEEITLADTQIICAVKRLRAGDNFKIVTAKAVKEPKLLKEKKEPTVRKPRAAKSALTAQQKKLLTVIHNEITEGNITLDMLDESKQAFYNEHKGTLA